MKITRVETMTVVVPVHEGSWHSPEFEDEGYLRGGAVMRLNWPDFPIVLMRLHTDEGLVGLGEVSYGVSASAVEHYAPFFVGRELDSFNMQELPVETLWSVNPAVYAGYEMALYDLFGKVLGAPVYRFFGGKYRDRVAVSRCSGRMNPDHAAKTAKQAVAQGYSVLKMKADYDDPVAERLQAIYDAVGDRIHVVIDPNQRFQRPARLFEVVRDLERAGIRTVQCFESPFDQGNLDWYALARQKINTPVALHLADARAVVEAVKREAADWMNLGGPMTTFYKLAAIADAAGTPVWHGSGVGLGISEAAFTHISAACNAVTLTSDICGETLRVDDLIVDPLEISDGFVRVPEKPGLGVELDENALDRYRVA